jgi:hypothetical protein
MLGSARRVQSPLAVGRVVSLGLAMLLGTAELLAQPAERAPDVVRASAEFTAPEGCGSRADLIARITRRSERIQFEAEPDPPRKLAVVIAAEGDALVATLELEQPSGRRSSRILRASTCDEALEAAALVAAVSLDPTASTAPERELPPPPAVLEPPLAPVTKAPPSRAGGAPAERAETLNVGIAAMVVGQASWGPAPSLLPGIGFALAVELDTGTLFSPLARASYVHSGGGGFNPETGTGQAAFELNQGALELCPVRFGSRKAALFPCPFFTGGRLLAQGSETLEAETHSRPWWVAGGALLALLRPIGPLELQLSGSVGIPLIRDTFQFAPGEPGHVVHEVPGAVFVLGLGAGAVFP